MKISSEPPTKLLFLWGFSRSRLKISSEIEVFKRKLGIFKRSSEIDFFQDSGPLGTGTSVRYPILQHIVRWTMVVRYPIKTGTKEFCETIATSISRPVNGGFQTGGVSRSGLVLPFLSFSVLLGLSRFFWDFPDLLGMVRGFSRFAPFLFLGLLRAPTRNSPERVRDTIWTFPEKSGKTPRFGDPQV